MGLYLLWLPLPGAGRASARRSCEFAWPQCGRSGLQAVPVAEPLLCALRCLGPCSTPGKAANGPASVVGGLCFHAAVTRADLSACAPGIASQAHAPAWAAGWVRGCQMPGHRMH